MSDPFGYNGSCVDFSGFAPCGFCGGVNCTHRGFATNATGATFERRGHVGERDNGEAERQSPREQSDRAMWDFVKSEPPPSARGSVTVRRPDGTTITCDVAQLQEVLEQVHKVRPRTVEVTGTYHSPVPGDE